MQNGRINKTRGYFGIGIINAKTETNIGTLWRSAYILGASFIFTIGKRYKKQSSDTLKSWRHIPLYHFDNFSIFKEFIPYNCELIGIEITDNAKRLKDFTHPERCIYLLGAEDNGIPKEVMGNCQKIVKLDGDLCYNVAVAGSIIMYDRQQRTV